MAQEQLSAILIRYARIFFKFCFSITIGCVYSKNKNIQDSSVNTNFQKNLIAEINCEKRIDQTFNVITYLCVFHIHKYSDSGTISCNPCISYTNIVSVKKIFYESVFCMPPLKLAPPPLSTPFCLIRQKIIQILQTNYVKCTVKSSHIVELYEYTIQLNPSRRFRGVKYKKRNFTYGKYKHGHIQRNGVGPGVNPKMSIHFLYSSQVPMYFNINPSSKL